MSANYFKADTNLAMVIKADLAGKAVVPFLCPRTAKMEKPPTAAAFQMQAGRILPIMVIDNPV